jgi:RNA polymerase sigma-70 factor, ECF subfamily
MPLRVIAKLDATSRASRRGNRWMVAFLDGQPFSIAAATVRNGKIAELDFLTDPERLRLLDLTILDG